MKIGGGDGKLFQVIWSELQQQKGTGKRSRGFFPSRDFPERHFSETHLSFARSVFKSNPNYKTRSIFDDSISNYSAKPFQVKSSSPLYNLGRHNTQVENSNCHSLMGRGGGQVVAELALDREVRGSIPSPLKPS